MKWGDKYFSLDDCNCGPFFFPKFLRCWLSKRFNQECYHHDISYREQLSSRSAIDQKFKKDLVENHHNEKSVIWVFYCFVRATSWFSWYAIKIDNELGLTKWGKRVKKSRQ